MNRDSVPPRLPVHRMRKYNPGKLSDAEIEAAFVAREELFERILDAIRTESDDNRAQSHLIVGQRGMGKTTLLLRLAAELRKPKFCDRLIPLVFAEEQYSVDRLSKFWLNCIDSLADAMELIGDTETVDLIDETVRKLPRSKGPNADADKHAAEMAFETLEGFVSRLGRRPVLLVDNLQIVFGRIKDQEHTLREILMRPGAPILVGASPQVPETTQKYSAAFFDQLKIHYLRALDLDAMRDVLCSLADIADRPEIRRHVLSNPGRLKALFHLTGGNPRTTVLLFHLYADDFSPSVYADLERLLDEVTPLYKARFEELSDQMQVVAGAIAEHWDPISRNQLSEMTGLTASSLSSQLDRLKKLGFIEEVELFGIKSVGFQIGERFFNVWFLMRHASRRQRRQITFLTRFLESLYQPQERVTIAQRMLSENQLSCDRVAFGVALLDTISDEQVRHQLQRSVALGALELKSSRDSDRLERFIDFDSLPGETLEFDELRRKLKQRLGDEIAELVLSDRTMLERRNQIAQMDSVDEEQLAEIEHSAKTSLERTATTYGEKASNWLCSQLVRGQICNVKAIDDWSVAIKNSIAQPIQLALVINTIKQPEFGRLPKQLIDQSENKLHQWLECTTANDWNAVGYDELGDDLRLKFHAYRDAENAYQRSLVCKPDFKYPACSLGYLYNHLRRYDEAEKAYRRAIEIDPKRAYPWNNLGKLFLFHLSRYDEAEQAFRCAIEIDPQAASSWNNLGNLYCDYLGRYSDAADALREVICLAPSEVMASANMVFLLRDFLGDIDQAREFFSGIEEKLDQSEAPDVGHLHRALFAAHDGDWNAVRKSLLAGLALLNDGFQANTQDDWIRTAAVLIHLGSTEPFLELLESEGADQTLRPWYEAIKAHHIGDRAALLNVAVEVRSSAEWFFDEIQQRRDRLPNRDARSKTGSAGTNNTD
ncbi:MAG: tetratricopeptide repeat protein [Planctomycetota bacterium]